MMFLVGLIIHPIETYRWWRKPDEEWKPARERAAALKELEENDDQLDA